MNIALLGHDDIASKIAFHRIVNGLPGHRYRLFLSGRLEDGAAPCALSELARLDRGFFGSLPWPPLENIEELPAPNSDTGLALLRRCHPDLIISVRYRRILDVAAIGIPRHGVLNLHSGLLPDYPGVMATFWAMLNDEPEIGCTLHRIVDRTIDTGPIVSHARKPVRSGWSYLANVLELYPGGCRLVIDAVNRIESGRRVAGAPQQRQGRYYSTPRPADLERYAAKGLRLADGGDLDAFLARHPLQRTG